MRDGVNLSTCVVVGERRPAAKVNQAWAEFTLKVVSELRDSRIRALEQCLAAMQERVEVLERSQRSLFGLLAETHEMLVYKVPASALDTDVAAQLFRIGDRLLELGAAI